MKRHFPPERMRLDRYFVRPADEVLRFQSEWRRCASGSEAKFFVLDALPQRMKRAGLLLTDHRKSTKRDGNFGAALAPEFII